MRVRTLRVSNFRTFRDVTVQLRPFNVLIGANASGKTSFLQVFRFLKDISSHGLDNAVSMQGGVEYLRNVKIGGSEDLSVEFTVEAGRGWGGRKRRLWLDEFTYGFSLGFKRRRRSFEVSTEKLTMALRVEPPGGGMDRAENAHVSVTRTRQGAYRTEFKLPEGVSEGDLGVFVPWLQGLAAPQTILLEYGFHFLPLFPRRLEDFSHIAVFDFDPRLPKRAVPITGRAGLDEDGGNLAIVLKNILENPEKRKKFSQLIRDLLPFVSRFSVEKFADKSLLISVKEVFSGNTPLPASLISDGTLSIAATLVALYFQPEWLILIEEPERNIHPSLISRLIGMMKEASRRRQILVTSQNPEVVRHADLEDLLLVSRDRDGYSTVSRPAELKEVRVFLEHDLGIEDLYVQGLLEGRQ